jgi:hypothetical protein
MHEHSDSTIDALTAIFVEHGRRVDEPQHWCAEKDEEGQWRLRITFVVDGNSWTVPLSPEHQAVMQRAHDARMRDAVHQGLQPQGLPPS